MAQNNKINFQIDFKKGDISAIQSLKKDILEIQRMAADVDFTSGKSTDEIQNMVSAARTLETALDQAFDVNLNTVNVNKFNQILKQSGYNAETLQAGLAEAGVTGQNAFLKMTSQLMEFNTATKLTNKFLDSIAVSLFNTIKWSALSSIVNNVSGAVQKSFYYVKDLDRSLNDIRIVTNKSADDMARFADEANNAAKALGVSTENYVEGSLIYYQQGLDDETVKTLTDITAMTSNVTGQAMSAVSEQLTAVWNGYQVANQAAEEGMQVYQEYVDKMAAVGATTASDLEELSTAMSKVASAASSMGVDFDDLNAQIATIVSVTRQAPESVGTALKTIYARLGDLKVDGVDEFGTKLGEVSSQLQTMGINVLDANGDMRQMTDVMAEVAEKWDTWTSAQKQAAAIAMAGKRQYNNLVALFDNWEMYGEALETSMNAAGTLQKQQEIAMDSLAKKMQVLQTTAEDLYDSLFNVDTITNWVEAGTGALQFLTDFTDAVGGLNNILPMLGSLGLQVFSNQIGRGLSTIVINARNFNTEANMMKSNQEALQLMFQDSSFLQGDAAQSQSLRELLDFYGEMSQYQSIMTKEQKEQYKNLLKLKESAGSLNNELEESAKNWQTNSKWIKAIDSDIAKDLSNTEAITNETNRLNKIVAEIMKEFETSQEITEVSFDIQIDKIQELGLVTKDAAQQLKNLFRSDVKSTNSMDAAVERSANRIKKYSEELSNLAVQEGKVKSMEKTWQNSKETFSSDLGITAFITNITKTVGALGQLTSAISTFKNVGNILNNDDLTNSEKFLQIVTNLSFSIPMLATSLVSLLGTVKKVEGAFKALSIVQSITGLSTKILNDEITREELVTILANKAMEEYAANKGIDIVAIDAETAALIRKQAAQDADTASLWLNTKAKIANFAASHPIAIAIAAIGVAALGTAKAIADYREQQVALIKKREEEQKTYLEQRKEKLDEIKQNQELAQSYMDLYAQYKDGAIAKEVMDEKSQSLIEMLGEEAVAVATLTGNYEDLITTMQEYQKQQIQERINEDQNVINETRQNILDVLSNKSYDESFYNALNERGQNALQYNEETGHYEINQNAEFEELQQVVNELWRIETNQTTKQKYSSLIDQLANVYSAQRDQDIALISQSLLENYDLANLNSYSEFNEVLSSTIKQLQDTGDYNDYNEAFDTAIDIFSGLSDNNKDFITRAKASKSLIDAFGEEYGSSIQEALEQYSDQEVAALLDMDWSNLSWDEFKNNLDENLSKAAKEYAKKISQASYDAGTTLLEKIQKGDITSENALDNEDFKEFQNNLLVLTKAYPDLIDEATILNNTWLIGTQEYSEALEKVQDALYKINLDTAVESVNEDIDDLFNTFGDEELVFNLDDSNIENFKDKLKEILDQEYSIDIQVHTEAEQEFDSISNAYSNLDDMASKIGEDFIVAASDIRELNNAFPGIIDGMEYLADGTIQLNDKVVHAAMAGAEAEAQADASATIEKLNNQAKLLRAKQAVYEKMANAAMVLANGEKLSEEESAKARGKISEGLEKLKSLNSQSSADSIMGNAEQIANNSYQNADATANNWNSAFQASTHASYQYAVAAIQNMNAVTSNGEIQPTDNWDNVSAVQYKGTSGDATITNAITDALESGDTDSEYWAELGSYYAQMADEAGAAANDIEGMIIQIGASSLELDSKLGSVASGKGPNADKGSGSDQDQKEFEDSYDRYWQIKKAIDAVDHSISVLEKDQKNLHGRELINSLKKENELLAEQQANYEALYELQKQEAAELRGKLSGSSLVFDATGAITNYAQATSEALATYANAVEQYNAGLIDEATLDVQEQAYNNFKKYLERYDELYYSEMQDTEDKIDDAHRKQLENNLKGWETEISIKLDLQEAERNWEDFIQEINDDFKSVYKDLNVEMEHLLKKSRTYTGKNGMDGTIGTDLEAMRNVMKEIDKMEGGGFSTMFESVSQAQEKLKELGEQLQDDAKDFHKLWEDAWDTYIDGIDQSADKLEDLMDQFKKLDEELEFQGELIELLYGEEAYGLMNSLYKGQEKSLENQVQAVKAQVDMWKQLFDASGATMENQVDWTADQQKYYEQWMDAQSDLNDLVIDYIKLLKTDYLNTIKDTLLTLEKSIAGVRLEDIGTEWERISDYSSKYLDNVEKAYETQKFANKIDQEIASITSLKAQQKLQAFRDKEITQLREKAVLNQYDLDAAEARYEIALKEIALEDAQANKMAMKLTRNEQGNWSYQYIADDEDVANKRQELLDAYNHLYEIASKAYEENLTSLQDLQEKYLESLEEIAELELTDKELAEQRRIELDAWYFEQYQLLAEENEIIRHDLATSGEALLLEVYRQDQEAVQGMTEFERALVQNLVDSNINSYMDLEAKVIANYNNIGDASVELMENTRRDWNSTAQEIAEAWNGDNGDSVRGNVLAAYDAMIAATEDYKAKVDWCAEASVRNFGPDGITGAINGASTATDALLKSTVDMVKKTTPYLENLRQYVDKIADSWYDVQLAIGDAMSALNEYLAKEISATMLTQDRGNWKSGSPDVYHSNKGAGNKNIGPSSQKTTLATLGYSIAENPYGSGKQLFTESQPDTIGDTDIDGTYLVGIQKDGVYEFIGSPKQVKEYLEELARKEGVSSFGFRTGGYTGDWTGTDGRMAMLHQKELVLNESDTKNFLDGISMLRDMSSLNGSISNAILSAVAGMAMNLGTLKASGYSGSTTSNVTNGGDTFNITAEFPNANDVNDIREALLSLPNLASQYIGRVAI